MGAHSAPTPRPQLLALVGAGAALLTVLFVAVGLASQSMIASVTVIVLTFLTAGCLAVRRDTTRYWTRYRARWIAAALVLGLVSAYASVSSDGTSSGSLATTNAAIGFVIGALFIGSLLNLVVAALPPR